MINITIVAPNIKSGGGKELLEYLLEYLHNNYKNVSVTVYLDVSMSHIKESINIKIILLKNPIEKIKLFYKKIDNSLYFGNLPPLRKTHNSMVYFHNPYLLMNIKKLFSSSIYFFIKYLLQQIYISIFIKNVDLVACQNNLIKDKFSSKYKFNNIKILPFFRLCKNSSTRTINFTYDFCYISLAHPHKNHLILFEAMEILSRNGINLKLAVTIENDKIELINKINDINNLGFLKIYNLGILPKNEVCQVYAQSKCLIFPSKEETFGLGLIEAVEMGLDVIASDLDYVYQVIKPSMVFNPDSAAILADTINKYINTLQKKSTGLIENHIEDLINTFIKGSNNV